MVPLHLRHTFLPHRLVYHPIIRRTGVSGDPSVPQACPSLAPLPIHSTFPLLDLVPSVEIISMNSPTNSRAQSTTVLIYASVEIWSVTIHPANRHFSSTTPTLTNYGISGKPRVSYTKRPIAVDAVRPIPYPILPVRRPI